MGHHYTDYTYTVTHYTTHHYTDYTYTVAHYTTHHYTDYTYTVTHYTTHHYTYVGQVWLRTFSFLLTRKKFAQTFESPTSVLHIFAKTKILSTIKQRKQMLY